jgi:hypothetical protein
MGPVILIKVHVASFYNKTGGLVIDYISVRQCGIPKKDTFIHFRLKLREARTFLENVALASKDSEVLNIWLIFSENFIWSLIQTLPKIETVDGMTSGTNSFGPKIIWRFEFGHYRYCGIH